MKIAIDARPLVEQPSGVGVYTRNLVTGLARRGVEDLVHLVSNRPVVLPPELPPRCRVHDQRRRIGNWWLQIGCPALLRREKIDVFHGTNFLAPLYSPCPTVVTVHDLTSFLMPRMHAWRNNMVQRLLPAVIRRAARVIAISRQTQQDLMTHLQVPESKIRLVYNGIGEEFKPLVDDEKRRRAVEELHLPDHYFLAVGNLERRKNLTGLLRGFAKFSRNNGNGYRLVLVGQDGPGAEEIRLLYRQLGLGERVIFLGYLDRDRLPVVYGQARALVFPSAYEGFGLPAVEAMACGTPVIASDRSGLAEVVGEAGLRVAPGDTDALATRLAEVAGDDHLRERLSAAGIERAARFSWEQFTDQTLAVYREAAEER